MVSVELKSEHAFNYAQAVRDYNWKVKFEHWRLVDWGYGSSPALVTTHEIRLNKLQKYIVGYGGVTICSAIKEVNGSLVEVRTHALCNTKDKYNRKIGAQLSAQRMWEFIQ